MRIKHKEWKNGKYPNWTCRIVWYQDGSNDIRLQLEDCDRTISIFPQNREEADQIWFMFKQGAPEEGVRQPFVTDLIEPPFQTGKGKWIRPPLTQIG